MFTGIIQALGTIRSLTGSLLVVDFPSGDFDEAFQIGESIAVNGCCLTVIDAAKGLAFDLSEETRQRTALEQLDVGGQVNLERAMRANSRFGGHIVQGHVDGVGSLVSRESKEGGEVFRFRIPDAGSKYLTDKGSIALDGVSLTVVNPEGGEFEVWVIPHTLAVTNLGVLQPGTKVNVEYDVIARHVEKLMQSGR